MSTPSRKYTNKVLELLEEGALDSKELAKNLLSWMSEADVEQFIEANDYPQVSEAFESDESEDEDED